MTQKREVVRAKTTHGGRMTKLTKDLLNDDERGAYNTIVKFFMDNYEIKEFVADQIALLKVYQMYYVWPKGGDITVTSEMMRKWAVEEKLTEKSKEKDISTTNITLGVFVERMEKGIDVEVVDTQQD